MKQKRNALVGIFLVLFVGLAVFWPGKSAQAANVPLRIVGIDYENETMTIESQTSDTMLFYSDGKMKTWECAYGTFSSRTFVLDISWVSKTKDYTISLKGNISETPVSVVLPKQESKLKVTFNCKTEKLEFENVENNRTIYWRKADSTTWHPIGTAAADQSATINLFKRFYAKGATICFRFGQIPGTWSNGKIEPGSRPSKEVKLKLTKQASAPSASVNTTKMTISATDKMEYSVDGSAAWTTCTKSGLSISEVAAAAFLADGRAPKDVKIALRMAATEKKLSSLPREITIKAQEAVPTNVTFEFQNSNTLKMVIAELKTGEGENEKVIAEAASKTNPYEYTVVKQGQELKDTASWTSVTSETTTFSKTKVPEGSKIYVRKKCSYSKEGVLKLASGMVNKEVEAYPVETEVVLNGVETDTAQLDKNDKVALFKTAGAKPEGLQFKLVIADIFKDTEVEKITCGGTELEFTSQKMEKDGYIVTITSTEKYEKESSTRDKASSVKITLKNGEVLSDKLSLTVLSGASVAKSAVFEIYRRTPGSPDKYTFVVKPGKIPSKEGEKGYTTSSITGITLNDISVPYTSTENKDNNWEVEISSDEFQKFFDTEGIELSKEYALTITSSDGTSIKDGIKVKFSEEAEITGGPLTFVKTVGSDLSESIVLELSCKKSNVYVSTVRWNGVDIMGNCSVQSGKIFVELDRNKVNGLTVPENLAAGTEISYPVIITLSDGAVVSSGYTLILKK